MMRKWIARAAAAWIALAAVSACGEVVVDAGVPTGNCAVERIEGDTVYLHPEMRDTAGWWFYWAFRVRGAAGRTLTFRFTNGEPVGTRGPAVSLDQGLSWSWLEKDFTPQSFTYTFGADASEARFAFGMVYTRRDWDRFLGGYAGSPWLEQGQLAVTRKGRPVAKLRLGCIGAEPRHRVLLTARHHACEMMANYALEGIVKGVLENDPKGEWLRSNVEFLIIPFVDTDGAEDGDQGKNRAPRDHARDYQGESVHVETAALRKTVPAWAAGKLAAALDLHCPHIRGPYDERVYQVGNPVMATDPEVWGQQERFGRLLEKVEPNVLAYRQRDDLPFGKAWHTSANYTKGVTMPQWAVSALPGIRLAGAFEIPYAKANGTVVDASSARQFGVNLATALYRYLAPAQAPAAGQQAVSGKVSVSGIYPHLAMYNTGGECGTGAVVPWADRLWAVTYSPHSPKGSNDKLYEITPDLKQAVRPESIGGTPANRMIHRESQQLFIGPYAIDANRNVRVIPYDKMFGRPTGNARHLTDPAGKIYYASMEEGFYEVDVRTLAVTELWRDEQLAVAGGKGGDRDGHRFASLPGYHGKGLYSGQGILIYANNGDHAKQAFSDPSAPSGCLAAWDGKAAAWTVVRRNQFTDVTGPGGIEGSQNPDTDPVWSIGWDHRSLILTVLDRGVWHAYRLPKGSHSYDGGHGWNTEWPRIREIGESDLLMTMHGTFWHFPKTFSAKNSAGIAPRSNYLKVVGDFCRWGDRLVLGCDDSAKSEFLNKRRAKGTISGPGQSHSNLWFVEPAKLDAFGPAIGRGALWAGDAVKAGAASEPYLFAGYAVRTLALAHAGAAPVRFAIEVDRAGDGAWSPLREAEAAPGRLTTVVFGPAERGAWVRLVPRADAADVYACFQYAQPDARPAAAHARFAGLATLKTSRASGGIVFARGADRRTLGLAAMTAGPDGVKEAGFYELDAALKLTRVEDPETLAGALKSYPMNGTGLVIEAASAVITDDAGRRWRFPKSDAAYDAPGLWGAERLCREICTERDLLNVCGTFYELPAENAGGFSKVRAVATHGGRIHDYCSYRGLLVLSGVEAGAGASDHVIRSGDGRAAVWVGAVDDLWAFGKPRGRGGPWKETAVKAGSPSDPYLMTGFDKKRLTLSHAGAEAVNVKLELDLTGTGVWRTYETYRVEPGREVRAVLDDARAYWLRLTADRSCKATAWLEYE